MGLGCVRVEVIIHGRRYSRLEQTIEATEWSRPATPRAGASIEVLYDDQTVEVSCRGNACTGYLRNQVTRQFDNLRWQPCYRADEAVIAEGAILRCKLALRANLQAGGTDMLQISVRMLR